MPIIEMVPGEKAKAGDVNGNFYHVMGIIGDLSEPGKIKGVTEFLIGPRNNTLLTATSDAVGATDDLKAFRIGWNVDHNNVSGKWRYARRVSGEPATLVTIGHNGFTVSTTEQTSGNLQTQMDDAIFGVHDGSSDSYIYLPPKMRIRAQKTSDDISDFRHTYVAFENPPYIYNGVALNNQDSTRDVTQYGVPDYAKLISIAVDVRAGGQDSSIRFLQERASPTNNRGFIVRAQAGEWASGTGIVPLGTGGYDGKIRIERTGSFSTAYVWISGYWL